MTIKTAYLTVADFFTVLRKNLLMILVAVLILGAAAAGLRVALPVQYASSSEYYVRNMQAESFLEHNGLTSSQLAAVQTLAKEYATLVLESDALLDRVIEKHDLALGREELRAMLTAESDNTVFRVTVTHRDPLVVNRVSKALEREIAPWVNETAWPNLVGTFDCVILLKAAAPAARSSASPLIWGVLGAFVGLIASYLFFLFRFLFGDRLLDAEEAHRALPEVPLLGELVPQAFPVLRTNLMTCLKGAESSAIAILDVEGAPGLLSDALADSLARAEKRVLLVDLKTPSEGDEQLPGLFTYLQKSKIDLPSLLRPCAAEGMQYLPAGETTSARDLLATRRMRKLLQTLLAEYEYILFDFDDAALAAALSDALSGYVIAVGCRRTGASALRGAHKTLTDAGGRVLGIAAHSADRHNKTQRNH